MLSSIEPITKWKVVCNCGKCDPLITPEMTEREAYKYAVSHGWTLLSLHYSGRPDSFWSPKHYKEIKE